MTGVRQLEMFFRLVPEQEPVQEHRHQISGLELAVAAVVAVVAVAVVAVAVVAKAPYLDPIVDPQVRSLQ